jgi:ABC-type branched-subunit amino acid transport system substrate-binding protein
VMEPSRAVFLSHASQDAAVAVANAVVVALERQGLKCWIAPRHVTPGAFDVDEIVRAIDATKAIALLLSPSAAAFHYVLREVERSAE